MKEMVIAEIVEAAKDIGLYLGSDAPLEKHQKDIGIKLEALTERVHEKMLGMNFMWHDSYVVLRNAALESLDNRKPRGHLMCALLKCEKRIHEQATDED